MNKALLIDQVRRQMNFITTSCNSYDEGLRAEAIRIATAARVLFHDTNRSRSLIRFHLQLPNLRLRSTAVPVVGPNAHFPGFIGMGPGNGFTPYGDDSPRDEQVDLGTWWSKEPILKLSKSEELVTRKELVLAAANTDGGAHVDTRRAAEYERLEAGLNIQLDVGYKDGSRGRLTLRFANLAALRQIGHEILTSKELIAIAESPIVDPWTGAPIAR
jgi:hypothetical protein